MKGYQKVILKTSAYVHASTVDRFVLAWYIKIYMEVLKKNVEAC